MKISVWHDSASWRVTSYGNGTAFEIINKEAKRSLWFQGDDALEFISELETHRQRLSLPDSLLLIWGDYAEISQEWSAAA